MSKKAVSAIFLAIASLTVCAVIAGSVVFAWIARNDSVTGKAGGIGLIDIQDPGVTIVSINGDTAFSDGYMVYPEDTLIFELIIRTDLTYFNIKMESPSEDFSTGFNFNTYFTNNPDFLLGKYEKSTAYTGGNAIGEYDIDKYLNGTALSAAQKLASKVAFLKEFEEENDVLDAFSISVVKINGVSDDIPLTRGTGSNSNLFSPVAAIALNETDTVTLKIVYGNPAFKPEMVISAAEAATGALSAFDAGTYYAQNYNCFTGRTIGIGFDTSAIS